MPTNYQASPSAYGQILYPNFGVNSHIAFSEFDNEWESVVIPRLEELVRLQRGWDGYKGLPVSFSNAIFAYQMLQSICSSNTPPPQIVPGSSGDLQLEWHTQAGDLELWVQGPNTVYAWCLINGKEKEMTLSNDFSDILNWVEEVTEPAIALTSAA